MNPDTWNEASVTASSGANWVQLFHTPLTFTFKYKLLAGIFFFFLVLTGTHEQQRVTSSPTYLPLLLTPPALPSSLTGHTSLLTSYLILITSLLYYFSLLYIFVVIMGFSFFSESIFFQHLFGFSFSSSHSSFFLPVFLFKLHFLYFPFRSVIILA